MENTKKILIFLLGVGIGSGVTYFFLDKKYSKLAQEEIDSVKEIYRNRYYEGSEPTENYDNEENKNDEPDNEEIVVETSKKEIKPNTRVQYSKIIDNEGYQSKPDDTDIYYISPMEFGSNDEEYECTSMYHYMDDVLGDDYNNMIENIADYVPLDYVSHFGEYEDDAVYVRNDVLKMDIEILRSMKTWDEVLETLPPSFR